MIAVFWLILMIPSPRPIRLGIGPQSLPYFWDVTLVIARWSGCGGFTGHSPTWVALQMSRTCSLVSSIVAKYRSVVSRLL